MRVLCHLSDTVPRTIHGTEASKVTDDDAKLRECYLHVVVFQPYFCVYVEITYHKIQLSCKISVFSSNCCI